MVDVIREDEAEDQISADHGGCRPRMFSVVDVIREDVLGYFPWQI
jgi:hypothetical protein